MVVKFVPGDKIGIRGEYSGCRTKSISKLKDGGQTSHVKFNKLAKEYLKSGENGLLQIKMCRVC